MNKADTARYEKLVELGCICCKLFEDGVYSIPEIHHPYGRKNGGNQTTYPLCFNHHNARQDNEHFTSRHPYKFKFEERYKTDAEFLEITNKLIK